MQSNFFRWLFEDPYTAGTQGGLPGTEPFRFLWPWLIFCCLGLLVAFYYSVEGRKRFVKSKPLVKYMLDKYLGWLAVICFIGLPLIAARVYMDNYFFAWRVWRYAWALSLVVLAVHWLYYMFRKYPDERANYSAYQRRQQYIKPNKKAKALSR